MSIQIQKFTYHRDASYKCNNPDNTIVLIMTIQILNITTTQTTFIFHQIPIQIRINTTTEYSIHSSSFSGMRLNGQRVPRRQLNYRGQQGLLHFSQKRKFIVLLLTRRQRTSHFRMKILVYKCLFWVIHRLLLSKRTNEQYVDARIIIVNSLSLIIESPFFPAINQLIVLFTTLIFVLFHYCISTDYRRIIKEVISYMEETVTIFDMKSFKIMIPYEQNSSYSHMRNVLFNTQYPSHRLVFICMCNFWMRF